MLSAVVQLLYEVQNETNGERRRAIIELATAAYPDLRPWQAKKACDVSKSTQASEALRVEMKNLYYSYLSLLLDPIDGHDAARRDPALVKVSYLIFSFGIVPALLYLFIRSRRYTHFITRRNGASSP